MATKKDTASFFTEGTAVQFEHVLTLYPQALRIKAENHKSKKPEELIKLDNWYQNELPKTIKSRGKDAHLNHDELVQTMKWKQTRGKFYPQLSYLVKVNTPRAVMTETKKAFKKLPNLEQALQALSNLKGVGITMASALLAAAAPENAPFMADECLKAIPEIEGIDYTAKEYMNFVQHIQTTVERLNKQNIHGTIWSPHRVELALWTHYIASELKPELLENIPNPEATFLLTTTENGNSHLATNGDSTGAEPSDDSNLSYTTAPAVTTTMSNKNNTTVLAQDLVTNGKVTQPAAAIDDNSTMTSFTEDSLDKPAFLITVGSVVTDDSLSNMVTAATVFIEDTNDSMLINEEDSSINVTPKPTDTEEDSSQDSLTGPPTKKSKK